MRIELENSMLQPTVHDPRYDDFPTLGYDEDFENDEYEERKFIDGDIAKDMNGTRVRILDASWDSWEEEWMYECEPIDECEWAWAEMLEHELSA